MNAKYARYGPFKKPDWIIPNKKIYYLYMVKLLTSQTGDQPYGDAFHQGVCC